MAEPLLNPPKLAHYGPKLKFRIEGNRDNKNCPSISVDPKHCLNQTPTPQNWSFSAQKSQSYPKFGLKSKVRIDGILENSSCSAFESTHKHLTEPYGNPKNSPI